MDLIFKEWSFSLSRWDLVFIVAVCVQIVIASAVSHPRWSLIILQLPVPFTAASLTIGRPIEATHALGLILLSLFAFEVRFLFRQGHVPIGGALLMASLTYGILAAALAACLPDGNLVFWIGCVLSTLFAVMVLRLTQHRRERTQRTILVLWAKLIVTIATLLLLVQFKNLLGGFLATFPILAITGMYETRNNLWNVSRQVPVFCLMMIPMIIVCRLTQQGQPPSLLALTLGWGTFLIALAIVEYRRARRHSQQAEHAAHHQHHSSHRHSVKF